MTITSDILRDELAVHVDDSAAGTAWTYVDLRTGETIASSGDAPVPVGDFEALVWFMATAHAAERGELDLSGSCTLQSRHRRDGNRGVIGCMSDGLQLSLGDFLAQTVITGDPAAFAVAAEAVEAQGCSSSEIIDQFLQARGLPGLQGRPELSGVGHSGADLRSTTTGEQVALLRALIDDSTSEVQGVLTRQAAERCLTVLGSVLKGGGLGRGLPGYGPFRTKVAHVARSGDGIAARERNDSAVFFDEGKPRFLVSASVHGIPLWQGDLPGQSLAEDFLMELSRACWKLTVGKI